MTDQALQPEDVVQFWRQAGPSAWFTKNPDFDADFRQRFLPAYEQAASGALDHWATTPDGITALMILLDQFPRNSFRGSAQSFATDAKALELARKAVEAGLDQQVEEVLRLFVYLPFEHSENLADQEESLRLIRPLGPELEHYAQEHLDIIQQFGRFPHRNILLGRASTAEEEAFLQNGGFAG